MHLSRGKWQHFELHKFYNYYHNLWYFTGLRYSNYIFIMFNISNMSRYAFTYGGENIVRKSTSICDLPHRFTKYKLRNNLSILTHWESNFNFLFNSAMIFLTRYGYVISSYLSMYVPGACVQSTVIIVKLCIFK